MFLLDGCIRDCRTVIYDFNLDFVTALWIVFILVMSFMALGGIVWGVMYAVHWARSDEEEPS